MRRFGESRCRNQQNPENKTKTMDAKKYKGFHSMNSENWLHDFRENLVDERSSSEVGFCDISSSSHEVPLESRAKVDLGSGKHSVYT